MSWPPSAVRDNAVHTRIAPQVQRSALTL